MIAFDRYVVLPYEAHDGALQVMMTESAEREGWLAPRNEGNSMEEEDLAERIQTAVWENHGECVGMHEWQSVFHRS